MTPLQPTRLYARKKRGSMLPKQAAIPTASPAGTVQPHQPGQAVFSDSARRGRLETVCSLPTFGAACGCSLSTFSVRTLHDQGESASRGEVDAASTTRGPDLHSHFRYLLHRPWRSLRRPEVGGLSCRCRDHFAGNTSHFHWAKSGDYITQVTAIGPLGLEYVNAKDNPRNEI